MQKKQRIDVAISPFSINKAWYGRKRRTAAYREWRDTIVMLLKNELTFTDTKEELFVELEFYVHNYGNADSDNPIKTTLDALTEAKIILDDRYIKKGTWEKFRAKKGEEKIIIKVSKYEV